MRGRHPSTTTPTPLEWDSPNVVTLKTFPNVLPMVSLRSTAILTPSPRRGKNYSGLKAEGFRIREFAPCSPHAPREILSLFCSIPMPKTKKALSFIRVNPQGKQDGCSQSGPASVFSNHWKFFRAFFQTLENDEREGRQFYGRFWICCFQRFSNSAGSIRIIWHNRSYAGVFRTWR